MKFPPPPDVIAVDVDGTIHLSTGPNEKVIAWLRGQKEKGFSLFLWSSRGEVHAKTIAERYQITDLFDVIMSKPGYILDDQGWSWIKFTQVVRRLD